MMTGIMLVISISRAAEVTPLPPPSSPYERVMPGAARQPAPPVPPPAASGTAPCTRQSPRPEAPTMPATGSRTAGEPTLRQGQMMFNFQEADIQAVVKTVSQITGKNFLIDPRVKGKLTIISTQPVSRKSIYQKFLASLKAQGYTAIDSASGFIKLVPLWDAKQNADVTTGVMPRPGEQTIT